GLDRHLAERRPAGGDRQGHVQDPPAFAHLRPPRQEARALGYHPLDRPFQRRQLDPHERVGRLALGRRELLPPRLLRLPPAPRRPVPPPPAATPAPVGGRVGRPGPPSRGRPPSRWGRGPSPRPPPNSRTTAVSSSRPNPTTSTLAAFNSCVDASCGCSFCG